VNKLVLVVLSASSILTLTISFVAILVASLARLNLSSSVFATITATFALGLLCGSIAWMLGLMQTARVRQWEWFVATLALGPVGALLFAGFGQRGVGDTLTSMDA